ncbi:MAG: protein-export chaperone SecB [Mariniphaga sp.]
MIALHSEIHLESFAVLQSHYQFIQPKKNPKEPLKIFRSYEIDIDFTHQVNEDKTVQVFTKIAVNQNEKPLPGYQLFVEGVAVFSLVEAELLSDSEQGNLMFYSTVSILIGYLRNTLTSITASSPLGPYLLPPINMADLFRKKSEINLSISKS